jgi:hypothetical protein
METNAKNKMGTQFIDLDQTLEKQYNRIIKDKGAIVSDLSRSFFTAKLIFKQRERFLKYKNCFG